MPARCSAAVFSMCGHVWRGRYCSPCPLAMRYSDVSQPIACKAFHICLLAYWVRALQLTMRAIAGAQASAAQLAGVLVGRATQNAPAGEWPLPPPFLPSLAWKL